MSLSPEPAAAPQWLTAIVLGIESPIGVTLIRELGRRGVRVIGIARSARAAGLHSRYLWRGVIRRQGEQALVDQLNQLADEHGDCVLLTVSETDLAFLHRNAASLTGPRLLIPPADRMAVVLDKARTRALAMQVGIDVPKVWQASSLGELAAQRAALRYPVVLKWAHPHVVSGWLHTRGLAVDKFRYCLDWPELERYLQQFEGLGTLPMIQEYCPGHGLGQSIFMHGGEALAVFQHRRLHEWPPEGGSSSLCESLDPAAHAELQKKSIDLLRAIGWEGPAMVEYRHNPATGRSCLMEINGRFWGSLPLASQAGVEFGWLTYSVLGLGEVPPPVTARGGMRCCFLVPEAKRWWRIWRHPGLIQDPTCRFSPLRETLGLAATLISPGTRYFLFSWSDPKPAWVDFRHGLLKRWLGRGDRPHPE